MIQAAIEAPFTKEESERFWKKVLVVDSGCWEWQGCLVNNRYGQFRLGGPLYRQIPAHRFAYEEANGRITDPKLFACHHCDNPKCVRPSHLFLGTAKDNSQDASRKGRLGRNRHHALAFAEPEQVDAAYDLAFFQEYLASAGKPVLYKVARRLGVSWATFDNYLKGRAQRFSEKVVDFGASK
jgi:hypothetical protein